MNALERELLRLYVEAEMFQEPRAAFDRLVSQDRIVLDMLWSLCQRPEELP
jgi:hypothetical protein